jgi:hypothetical protein
MRVLLLNKNQIVPRKQLGMEWENLEVWWPDTVAMMGRDLGGRVLVDEENGLAIIGVVKFKSSPDTVSIRRGLGWLAANGYRNVEIVDTSNLPIDLPVKTKKPSSTSAS